MKEMKNKIINKKFLFNVYNNYKTSRKEITFLGIKLKIYNKKLTRIPNYTKVLNKIKEKYKNKEKIRVGFYVSENAKWNAEELYRLLEKNEQYEPIVIVSLLEYVHTGDDITRNNLKENYEFFKNSGKKVVKAYNEEKKEYIALENFDIDIVFYQQPWGIPDIHNIDYVKDFALCCHFHYGLHIFKSKITDIPFYKKLFIYFVNNKNEEIELKAKGYQNVFTIGYPKLDIYKSIKRVKKETEKKTIIYAPHLSYKKRSVLKIGTFNETGIKLLKFAQQHSEYNWIFKPHPALKNQLYNDKKYGKEFVEKYYSEWNKLGNTYEQGNYFNLFINSDLMITDCSSFLIEYLPTKAPLFRLERIDSVPLNDFGEELIENLYRIYNFQCFEKTFNEVIKNNTDYLQTRRIEFVNKLLEEKTSSQRIIDILFKMMKEEENK